jgi:hypothetical protein
MVLGMGVKVSQCSKTTEGSDPLFNGLFYCYSTGEAEPIFGKAKWERLCTEAAQKLFLHKESKV